MNINQISASTFCSNTGNMRKLVPLSEYKGQLLQLTKSDIAKINGIKETITQLEMEHYDLNKYIIYAKQISKKAQDKLYDLEICIESLKAEIRSIKTERLKKQAAAV